MLTVALTELGIKVINNSNSTANTLILKIKILSGNYATFLFTSASNETDIFSYSAYDQRFSSIKRLLTTVQKLSSAKTIATAKELYLNINSWSGHKQIIMLGGNVTFSVENVETIPDEATTVTIE